VGVGAGSANEDGGIAVLTLCNGNVEPLSPQGILSRYRTLLVHSAGAASMFAAMYRAERVGSLRMTSAMERIDPYELLGVDDSASVEEVKQAFHQMANKVDPCIHCNDS
jgi:DnaJ-domain-containing protein 1